MTTWSNWHDNRYDNVVCLAFAGQIIMTDAVYTDTVYRCVIRL